MSTSQALIINLAMIASYSVVAPGFPFVLWLFFRKIKNDKVPVLECILLAIGGIVYTYALFHLCVL